MESSILLLFGADDTGTENGPDLFANADKACSLRAGPPLLLRILNIRVPMTMITITVAPIATHFALCRCFSGKFSSVDISPA